MYIQPQTNIRLLSDVPIDNTYTNTFRFKSTEEQASYFLSKTKYSFNDSVYQRVNKGSMRVGINAENLYNCNYLMFQNAAFGSKWFYAFITSVEYANDNATDINFEIDVLQTWFFDYVFEDCFIDREHTATDEIGDNITAEPVETGEPIFANGYRTLDFSELCVIMAVCDAESVQGANLYDGVYSGCQLTAFNVSDISGIRTALDKQVEHPDQVVAMYMIPKTCLRIEVNDGGSVIPPNAGPVVRDFSYDYPVKTDTIGEGGYVPKNKKLYTYPYNYLRVFSAEGSSINTRFEFFLNHNPRFKAYCTISNPVSVVVFPVGYKSSGVDKVYPDENMTISGFPTCSWNNDTYKIWTAQNTVPYIMQGAFGAARGMVQGVSNGGAVGAMTGAIGGMLGAVEGALTEGYKASIAADQYRGSSNTGGTITPAGLNNVYYGRMCVSDEFARMIDNFFTMYGYAIKQVEHPNIYNRPHYCYLKTIGCNVAGSVPADDMRKICEIHDNGVTYWDSDVTPGDYSIDNTV